MCAHLSMRGLDIGVMIGVQPRRHQLSVETVVPADHMRTESEKNCCLFGARCEMSKVRFCNRNYTFWEKRCSISEGRARRHRKLPSPRSAVV